MSCSYAEGLSPYDNKGKLGLPESFDSDEALEEKVDQLFQWFKQSRHVVFYTGAGISTSAGIPDFRGPKGVWTLEKKGLKPDINVSWDDAKPTKAHMAISKLVDLDKAHFVVSQNIDGLHLRSGLARNKIAELHGDMFVESCNTCNRMFVRKSAATSVGQKLLGTSCPQQRSNGRPCRGKLCDFVLDWEAELPDNDLDLSNAHSTLADLSIVIGSTLQIIPAGTMPTLTKKFHGDHGKLVIINLQPTKQDKKADLIIRKYADVVMEKLFQKLGIKIPDYNPDRDPILQVKNLEFLDWTQSDEDTKIFVTRAEIIEAELKAKRKEKKLNKLNEKSVGSKPAKTYPKSGQNGSNVKLNVSKVEQIGLRNHVINNEADPEDSHDKTEEVKLETVGFLRTENDESKESKIDLEDNHMVDNSALIKTEDDNKSEILKRVIATELDMDSPVKISRAIFSTFKKFPVHFLSNIFVKSIFLILFLQSLKIFLHFFIMSHEPYYQC